MTKKELNILVKHIKKDFDALLTCMESMNKFLHKLDRGINDKKGKLGKK